jgi:4-amino-4-deoxy-L-arabinose transferase-like glycosyltransferase
MMKNTKRWVIWGIIAVLIVIGAYFRLKNLGQLSFWFDEVFTAFAAKGVLEHGLPLFPSGYLYPRAIAYSYMTAVSFAGFGINEFSGRLLSALFSTAMIPLTYVVGRRFFSQWIGIGAALVVTFSAWQIEFGRYARMYAMFQLLYILTILLVYKGFIQDNRKFKVGAIASLALTLMTHQLGGLLLLGFIGIWIIWREQGKAQMDFSKVSLRLGGVIVVILILVLLWQGVSAFEFLALFGMPSSYYFKSLWQAFHVMNFFVVGGLTAVGITTLQALKGKGLTEKTAGRFYLAFMALTPFVVIMLIERGRFRYLFHLMPMFFMFYLYGVYMVSVWLSRYIFIKFTAGTKVKFAFFSLFFALSLLLFTEHISPAGAIDIVTRSQGSQVDPLFAPTQYATLRTDQKAAADFLQDKVSADSTIIVEDAWLQHLYYGPVDYWLRSTDYEQYAVNLSGRLRDRYTETPIITTLEELRGVLTSQGDVYIVTGKVLKDDVNGENITGFLRGLRPFSKFSDDSGLTEVLHIGSFGYDDDLSEVMLPIYRPAWLSRSVGETDLPMVMAQRYGVAGYDSLIYDSYFSYESPIDMKVSSILVKGANYSGSLVGLGIEEFGSDTNESMWSYEIGIRTNTTLESNDVFDDDTYMRIAYQVYPLETVESGRIELAGDVYVRAGEPFVLRFSADGGGDGEAKLTAHTGETKSVASVEKRRKWVNYTIPGQEYVNRKYLYPDVTFVGGEPDDEYYEEFVSDVMDLGGDEWDGYLMAEIFPADTRDASLFFRTSDVRGMLKDEDWLGPMYGSVNSIQSKRYSQIMVTLQTNDTLTAPVVRRPYMVLR